MRLVTVAHGTRTPAGNDVAREITVQAGALLGMEAVCSFVELSSPLFADAVPASSEPTIVVPLLLSAGYHIRHDLPQALREVTGPVRLGPPLGPSPQIAAAQVQRLREAGATPGQPVVMVAAGSRDALATRDLRSAVSLLGEAWGGPVRLATLAGRGDRPTEVVRPLDAVSPYLLATGHFAHRCGAESPPGAVVADVVGVHPRVVELVARRGRALVGSRMSA
jgi:sirohydrochlorin ferrochelatase